MFHLTSVGLPVFPLLDKALKLRQSLIPGRDGERLHQLLARHQQNTAGSNVWQIQVIPQQPAQVRTAHSN